MLHRALTTQNTRVQTPFFEKTGKMQSSNTKILQRQQSTKYSMKKAQDPLNLVLFLNCSLFVLQRWWTEVDSNHRSRRRQIYSLIHLAALESVRLNVVLSSCAAGGAGDWNRTHNLLITNQLLCQLSYAGILVPQGGIEPPTEGFSVPCSTD